MIELHDFTKGKSAQFLSKVRNLTFEMFRNVELIDIDGIKYNPSKIEIDENGFAIYKNGEERLLLFYYKPHLVKTKFGSYVLPKYHVIECETRQEYGGFVFANRMPVEIASRETRKTTLEELELCKNCSKQIFKSWWGSKKPWYESVLKYISENNHISSFFTSGELKGYHVMWRQISEAYRESVGYKCESCNIDLSNKEERKYLHTHHIDEDKTNNTKENFQALCLLCHSLKHPEKLTRGTGFLEVQEFIDNYKNRLNQTNISEYERIKRNTGHNIGFV
jgi:hypothetical protein